MAESAFGGEASSKLSKFTIILCVLFFVSAFGLALTRMAHVKTKGAKEESSLPQITDVVQKPKKKGVLTGQDNIPTQPVSNKQEQPISVDQKPATHSIAPISLKREEPTEEKGEEATQVQQVTNQKITEETTSEQKLSTPAAPTVFKLDTQPAIAKDADQGTHSDDAKTSLSPLSNDTEKNSQIRAEDKPSNGLAPHHPSIREP